MSSVPADHFEALYRADPDPWEFATSPYEREKYAHTVAALGARRYGRGLELGCSIGILTRQLAAHCEALVACDAAPTALAAARARVATLGHVQVVRAVLPRDIPPGRWDLVVASEVLYYLDRRDLELTLDRLEAVLLPGGVLLAVHWTQPTLTHPLQGDVVHEAIVARTAFTRTLHERHPTYRLDRFERR